MENMTTTVIGSYPVKIENMDLMDSYYDKTNFSWKKYIDS